MWLHYLMRGCSPRLGSGGRFPNPIRAVQQSAQLVFAVEDAVTAAILAVIHEQIEREEARIIAAMEEQVLIPLKALSRASTLCLIAKFQTLNERTPLRASTIKVILPLRKIVAHSVKSSHGIAAFLCRFPRSADELVSR